LTVEKLTNEVPASGDFAEDVKDLKSTVSTLIHTVLSEKLDSGFGKTNLLLAGHASRVGRWVSV
jgi:hypothetical protein